ncbi:MAG: DUF1385 domain-containing protein [Coriobacteriales bacterium]|jgi:uncharacterized protein YqhQ|nr:DUF1385 domain-containing protein [Coriobacteriales bacterium]
MSLAYKDQGENNRAAGTDQSVAQEGREVSPGSGRRNVFDESDVVCQTHVGGQALIEGIMMRGRYNWALAVRCPDNSIYVEQHDLVSGKDKNSWMYKPVVRGCTALVESLALGFKAMEIAANHALAEEDEPKGEAGAKPHAALESQPEAGAKSHAALESQPEAEAKPHAALESQPEAEAKSHAAAKTTEVTKADSPTSASGIPKPVLSISMIVGVLLGIGIFVALPALITNLLVGDYGERTLLWNIVDGVLRVAIFVAYIWLIGRMGEIKRMFGYHGAEHRTIHCYERGQDLTVANAQRYPSLHVRCGTAFMLMTMIIAIFVFTIVPVNWLLDVMNLTNEAARLGVVIASRIVLLPLIAGLSYEVTVKWAGAHPDNRFVRFILWPGLQLQRLTTNPPDDGMIECAIAAMQCVLQREQAEAEDVGADSDAGATVSVSSEVETIGQEQIA